MTTVTKKFKVGGFDNNNIFITKIQNGYIWVYVKYFGSIKRELNDVKFRRKIFVDKNGVEYIKPIYHDWGQIFKPSARQIDSDDGFDMLEISAERCE
tara:strand:- start:267 stop:557 length:291 start_codon:yes stop_codon:yes gene_type:complete